MGHFIYRKNLTFYYHKTRKKVAILDWTTLIMNWIKPKGKRPSSYLDKIKKSLGFESARMTIVGDDSQTQPENEIEETVIGNAETNIPVENVTVTKSPVNIANEVDQWQFPPKEMSYLQPKQTSSKWEAKLRRVLSKQAVRVHPATPVQQPRHIPSFASIFDQVSIQLQEQSETVISQNAGIDKSKKSNDQTVPEYERKEAIHDSQSNHNTDTSFSRHSNQSLEKKVQKSVNDIELAPETPVRSLEFNATQEMMRPSHSVELIGLIPSTPLLTRSFTVPKTPQKRKSPEQNVMKIELRYSPSVEQSSPICCSNHIPTNRTVTPNKKLKMLRNQINRQVELRCKEIVSYVNQKFNEYESEFNSAAEEDDYAGLFTPNADMDPFDE
jgi:hypothetical protein